MPETHGARDRRLKAVIFDMDNTLFEFMDAQVKACKAVVNRLGVGHKIDLLDHFLKSHDFEDHRNISAYMSLMGIDDPGVFSDCCRVYEETKLDALALYEGVKETLLRLKGEGLILAVVTNADRKNACARLERTGLKEIFEVVVSLDESMKKKPDPGPVKLALDMMGVEPGEALLVGDSIDRDIAAGRALGVLTAYAAYGDKNFWEVRSEKADFRLDCIQDLERIIRDNFSMEGWKQDD